MIDNAARGRFKTLNGKHSALCHSCGRVAYPLWISDEPPPLGCSEGHDDEIWKCGTVYTAVVAIVIGLDHMNREPDERQRSLLDLLGKDRADAMMAYIRSGKMPPSYRPKEPDYERTLMS